MSKPYIKLRSTSGLPHEEWLELRRQGIGGSDAGAILGANPYRSSLAVYNDKLGIAPPVKENEKMRFGSLMEPQVAAFFTEKTGKKARRFNFMLQSVEHPFMLANVDYVIPGEKAILECKVMYEMTRYKLQDGEYPAHYKTQCLHYMAVLGCDKAYLAIYKLGEGLYIFEIERDEKEMQELIRKETYFWKENIWKKQPPKPDGSPSYSQSLQELYPETKEEQIVPLFGMERWFGMREDAARLIQEGERQKAEAEQQIKLRMGEASKGQANGYMAQWKASASKSTLDQARLKAERPDIYEEYQKPKKSSRIFTVKKMEEKPVAI